MATSNSLDQVSSADVDHSAVTDIVGSLGAHLTTPLKTASPSAADVRGLVGLRVDGTSFVQAKTNGGIVECSGVPAVIGGSAVFAGKVLGPGGVGVNTGLQRVVEGAGVGVGAVKGECGGGVALQEAAILHNTSVNNGAAGVKPVYGVGHTPMTGGAHGTQVVVNGGVPGGAHTGSPQVSLQTQSVLKGLTKVVTTAGAAGQPAVIMSKPGTVTAVPSTGTPGTVPIPQGMQIINMRPGQAIKTTQGATTIAPRMILSPQVLQGVRPGQPGQITLGMQGLPPGTQGHLLVKTENGQLQLLRVNTAGPAPGQLATSVAATTTLQQPPTTAYRFQQPQNTAALSSGTTTTMATQAAVIPATLPSANPGTTVPVAVVAPNTPTTQPAPTQPAQPPTVGSQTISAESAKTKCKNFLATLLKLANEQRATVARNVRNLIQGLIDGRVEPEAFTEELQKDLNSSPQPCLVPFLKKTLPYLRTSLARGELSIDGVRPPPLSSVTPVTGVTTVIPAMSVVRGGGSSSGTVRTITPGAATTVQRPLTATPTPQPRVISQVQPVRLQGGKTVVTTVRQNNAMATSPATTPSNAIPAPTKTITLNKAITTKDKDKNSKQNQLYNYSGDDDINDVAAMGGVNLGEESQRILESTGFVGTQIRSCKDENFLLNTPLTQRIKQICSKYGLEEAPKDVVALVSHATQERLKTIVEKLAVISEHRLDIIKSDSRYEVVQDVKGQLRFLEELDKLEKKRKEEQEREMLMRAAKSRSKSEDPETAKLKAKAKEMQRVEMEEMRQRDANRTALNALQGPKKKPKLDLTQVDDGATFSGTFSQKYMPLRPRIKRVNIRDLMFLMEQEKELCKSTLLYRSYLK